MRIGVCVKLSWTLDLSRRKAEKDLLLLKYLCTCGKYASLSCTSKYTFKCEIFLIIDQTLNHVRVGCWKCQYRNLV